MSRDVIELRGVAVNNLRHIDLDLPRGQLIVFCGVSGSGKTSLALDTLYAEGQRRYIETFSPYTRQFLEQLDKPEAVRIDGIPPAIAVTHKNPSRSTRATVGTTTEVNDYLSLLFARVGEVVCRTCGQIVRRDTSQSAAEALSQVRPSTRIMIGFESRPLVGETVQAWVARLIEAGYVRAIVGDRSVAIEPVLAARLNDGAPILVVIDRLVATETATERLSDSLETAFAAGNGEMVALVERSEQADDIGERVEPPASYPVDGRPWLVSRFSTTMRCDSCGNEYLVPEPQLFNFNGPLGACPTCEGSGHAPQSDADRAAKRGRTARARDAAATSLESAPCPACNGARLRPEALAVRVAGKNFSEVVQLKVADVIQFLDQIQLPAWQQAIAQPILNDIRARLMYLISVGIGYLALDRPLRSLSSGEAQRVALTATLGSSLVDMLYVLDEPSIGLHPRDVASLATQIDRLRERGNTVIVVEHEPEIIRRAAQVVEIGPGAGEEGGEIVFQGTPEQLAACKQSRTGDWIAGRRGFGSGRRRAVDHGRVMLRGARGRNLRNVNVEFPLGVMCVVTGVSGAGKSSLVARTLYPALVRRLHKDTDPATFPEPLECDDVLGVGQLDDVVLVDQSPIGRSPRSNPATYLKAFDPIRTLFAELPDARARGYTASHFSFNVDGGRCEACKGDGVLSIDMQFMADVTMRCRECGGRRYRREILDVKYRGRDIAEVLDMTAREAFTWFRGERAVQARLKPLLDVGLDYLRLGQSAKTLSGGEAQRLKLAAHLAANRRGRTLFLLDEPTTGLHFSDIVQLTDCFDALLDVGHSLIIVEHNLQLVKAADYMLDLGPGAADEGGRVVAVGTPEEVAACRDSVTGQFLAREFARELEFSKQSPA